MTCMRVILIASLALTSFSAFGRTSRHHHRAHMMNVHRGHLHNMNVHRAHMKNMREHASAMRARSKRR